MNCCQCQGIEELFDDRLVTAELAAYRRKGPSATTRLLIRAITDRVSPGQTLLDIGGGVGALQHALLDAGVSSATDVDASQAYLRAASQEAERRGIAGRVTFQHANFVDVAPQLPPADIVTLDRVICCYHDMQQLVGRSAEHARQWYGVVFPRDDWWVRAGVAVMNFIFRLQKRSYRTFSHPTRAVESIVAAAGLKRSYFRRTFFWQVILYSR